MMSGNLRGKKVLDVGCGVGAHSSLFKLFGANVIALDLTKERVVSASKKMNFTSGGGTGRAIQGDALSLPFPDDHFDIVYSNGVLHHTGDVPGALDEIIRVLKPYGKAAIMLYAKNSFLYRCVLYPVRGLLQGGIFRNKNWLGAATEWMSDKEQTAINPKTEVFSGREVRHLFRSFRAVKIRKNSFTFEQMPIVGKCIGKFSGRWTGYNKGGILTHGFPWRNETDFELWIGRLIGFGLNISAVK